MSTCSMQLLLLLKYLPTTPLGILLISDAALPVQEQSRVFNEELRGLVLRAVIGVWVDDELRIRDVLLHDE